MPIQHPCGNVRLHELSEMFFYLSYGTMYEKVPHFRKFQDPVSILLSIRII